MIGWTIVWLLIAIGAVLLGAAVWVRRTFGEVSIDQMLLNLPGAGGAETTAAETGYISSFVWQAVAAPLLAVAVLLGIWLIGYGAVLRRRAGRSIEFEAHPSRWLRLQKWIPAAAAVLAVVTGGAVFAQTIGLPQYLRSMTSSMSMADHYVAPDLVHMVEKVGDADDTEPLKNLIIIYLESTDDGFSNADLFGRNLLAPLQEATSEWGSIPALRTYEGGGWTMAGIVGTQCGVPLRGPGIGENDINSNEIGADFDTYMPGAICLGDVLDTVGYTSVFLGGADARFASKERFLKSHGYSEVRDLAYWQEEGEVEFSAWGLSDRRLFEQARVEVARLHEAGEPFNLTLLTLDFHEPFHRFEHCPQVTDIEMGSVLICAMEQVADFVGFLAEQGYLEDTVVVIMADHPKMVPEGTVFSAELAGLSMEERLLFNRIWAPDGLGAVREQMDQLSMFATVLDLLGLGESDGRAGLGLSAFVGDISGTLLDLPDEEYVELLQSRSADLYGRLWGIEDAIVDAATESS